MAPARRRDAVGVVAVLLIGTLTFAAAPAAPAVVLPTQVTSVNFTYVPPEITIRQGGRVTYTNIDIALHNVTSLAAGTGGPLFTSDTISAGEATPVLGVENLAPGVYDYTCTLHTFMIGSIIVTD